MAKKKVTRAKNPRVGGKVATPAGRGKAFAGRTRTAKASGVPKAQRASAAMSNSRRSMKTGKAGGKG